jgi:hypothetical protein
VFGYSKQAYYKQLHYREQTSFDEYLIVGLIAQKRKIWKRGSGRNLWKSLQVNFTEHKINIGREISSLIYSGETACWCTIKNAG